MRILLLFFVSLLHIIHLQESEAETKYAKLGTDVILAIKTPVQFKTAFDLLSWKFNKSVNILRLNQKNESEIHMNYTNRVELQKNYDLLLKNLQMQDSGHYEALFTSRSDQSLSEYNLNVQATVSPVKMEVASVWFDSISCNVTVTCSSEETHLKATFGCYHNVCKLGGMEQPSGAQLLTAFVSNSSLVCQNRNEVSENHEAKEVKHVCREPDEWNGISTATWIGMSAALVLVLHGFGFMVLWIIFKRSRTAEQTESEVCQMNPVQNVDDNHLYSESSPLPNAIYSMVTYPRKPRQTSCALLPEPTLGVNPVKDTEQYSNPLLAL
ncbi:SLAM family member 6-like isoform X2 [Stigmatopora argus]